MRDDAFEMVHDSEEFYFGYLRRLEDGRVLGRVAFDTTDHAQFPEVELGRVGVDVDLRALRLALADGFAGWIRRSDWSRAAVASAARARDAGQRNAVPRSRSTAARAVSPGG